MNNGNKEERFFRTLRKFTNKSLSATKGCYFLGCDKTPIRAHSISNKRLLLKLADNGYVMYFNKNSSDWGSLVETGRGRATTFDGFCDDHDKIFRSIDSEDYVIGNEEQNYLFALRAAAREYTTRKAMSHLLGSQIDNNDRDQEFSLDDQRLEMASFFQTGFDKGLDDQRATRGVFVSTALKGKYNVIESAAIVVNEELPVAVSSTFNLELAYDGSLINDLSPGSYSVRMKPCFLTVFPQNGKTYCIVSYFRRDRRSYDFLKRTDSLEDKEKRVIISNLVVSYTENFTANPMYWKSLSYKTKAKYSKIFANSMRTIHTPFVADVSFSLFQGDQ